MEFNTYKQLSENKLVVMAKNSTHSEIKKVYKVISSMVIGDARIKISNDENIVTITITDNTGNKNKVKDALVRTERALKSSKINIEDIWIENNTVGLILADY